jgi:hypothetical protein
VCGELLLVARLNNLPTHEKRLKAYAEPKAAGLTGRGQNLWNGAAQDRGASHARATAKFDFWVYEPLKPIQRKHTDAVTG